MKKHIYLIFSVLICTFMACQKEMIDVRDFGKVSIDSISPATGPAGTYVVVHGYNFTYRKDDAKVYINNAPVNIITMAIDSMIVQIPEGAATGRLEFNFNRKNPIGGYDYSDQVDSAFTGPVFKVDAAAVPAPIIQEVLPGNGRAGAEIVINGYNFKAGNCKLLFGETEGTITEISGLQIKVKVPKVTPGNVTLRMEQGTHNLQLGIFTIDETPKGVKEILWTSFNKVFKAVMDDEGNPIISTIIDDADNIMVNANGLTVDQKNGRVYFMDVNKVYVTNIDGSGTPTVVYTFSEVTMLQDIALDSQGRLYISAFDAGWTGANHILRVNTDGTGAEEIYKLGESVPGVLKVDESRGKIYWVDLMFQTVNEGSIDGETAQAPKVLYNADNGVVAPTCLALDDIHIYMVDGNTGSCLVGPRDGSGVPVKLPVPLEVISGAGDLEIDPVSQYLYWCLWDFQVAKGTLYRCKTDGTGVQRVIEGMAEASQLSIVL